MNMQLKERVREAMTSAGLSPASFARACKVSKATVTFWLDGTTKELKGPSAAKIEAATGYLSQWLINGKLPKKANADSTLAAPSVTEITFEDAIRVIAERLMGVDQATARRAMSVLSDLAEDPADHGRLARATNAVIETGKRRYA